MKLLVGLCRPLCSSKFDFTAKYEHRQFIWLNITNLKHLVVLFNNPVKSRSVKNENINIQDISVLDFSKPAYIYNID